VGEKLEITSKVYLSPLDSMHPGITKEILQENTGFTLDFSRCRGETLPPTYEELEILYRVVDPEGIFLSKK